MQLGGRDFYCQLQAERCKLPKLALMRVGIGYDIHALKKGRKLILGGVEIPHPKGLQGHSDADVALHAIVDAALGAAAAGDLGDHFSDKDLKNKDANSLRFVEKARQILKKKGFAMAQLDAVILAEEPKLGPHKHKIRKSLAAVFGVPLASVGLKAKTNEGFGAVGRKKAIACHAVVTLKEV